MPKKEKKTDKKGQKENKDQISAVDRTFFEITINDLNNKLINLRKRNGDLEERNADLETQMVQLDEDRADVIAYLRRTVLTQTSNIKDLEEKLLELAKVRADETERFRNIITDWESKYKAMHDQLSSEIKLLAGKLNYLEEFRLQHDDLMAKFDQQDRNLKEQEQRHKDTLYELEHKQITEKVQLKNQLESRLLQLSNEFARTNQIRTVAHVQRMTRENIALNNEIDRLLHTVERLTSENQLVKVQNREKRYYSKTISEENAHLMEMCQKYLKIINRLTIECERLEDKVNSAGESEKLRKIAEVRETGARKELNESKAKLESLKASLAEQQKKSAAQLEIDAKLRQKITHLLNILQHLKQNINEMIHTTPKTMPLEMTRQQLLDELLQMLTSIEDIDDTSIDPTIEIAVADEMMPLTTKTGYQKGNIGIAPRQSTTNMFKYVQPSYKGRRKSIMDSRQKQQQFYDSINKRSSLVGCAIIDVDDDTSYLNDEIGSMDASKSMDDEKIELKRKPSIIQLSRESSIGDGAGTGTDADADDKSKNK